jgi:hypothetical protein
VLDEWFDSAGRLGNAPDIKKLERLLHEHKGKLDINACNPYGFPFLALRSATHAFMATLTW